MANGETHYDELFDPQPGAELDQIFSRRTLAQVRKYFGNEQLAELAEIAETRRRRKARPKSGSRSIAPIDRTQFDEQIVHWAARVYEALSVPPVVSSEDRAYAKKLLRELDRVLSTAARVPAGVKASIIASLFHGTQKIPDMGVWMRWISTTERMKVAVEEVGNMKFDPGVKADQVVRSANIGLLCIFAHFTEARPTRTHDAYNGKEEGAAHRFARRAFEVHPSLKGKSADGALRTLIDGRRPRKKNAPISRETDH